MALDAQIKDFIIEAAYVDMIEGKFTCTFEAVISACKQEEQTIERTISMTEAEVDDLVCVVNTLLDSE